MNTGSKKILVQRNFNNILNYSCQRCHSTSKILVGRPLAKRFVSILLLFVMSSGEKHFGNMKKQL